MRKFLQLTLSLVLMFVATAANAWKFTVNSPAEGKVDQLFQIVLDEPAGTMWVDEMGAMPCILKCSDGTEYTYNMSDNFSAQVAGTPVGTPEIVAPGTYTLTIPAETFHISGVGNEEQTFTWTIGGGEEEKSPYTLTYDKSSEFLKLTKEGCTSYAPTYAGGATLEGYDGFFSLGPQDSDGDFFTDCLGAYVALADGDYTLKVQAGTYQFDGVENEAFQIKFTVGNGGGGGGGSGTEFDGEKWQEVLFEAGVTSVTIPYVVETEGLSIKTEGREFMGTTLDVAYNTYGEKELDWNNGTKFIITAKDNISGIVFEGQYIAFAAADKGMYVNGIWSGALMKGDVLTLTANDGILIKKITVLYNGDEYQNEEGEEEDGKINVIWPVPNQVIASIAQGGKLCEFTTNKDYAQVTIQLKNNNPLWTSHDLQVRMYDGQVINEGVAKDITHIVTTAVPDEKSFKLFKGDSYTMIFKAYKNMWDTEENYDAIAEIPIVGDGQEHVALSAVKLVSITPAGTPLEPGELSIKNGVVTLEFDAAVTSVKAVNARGMEGSTTYNGTKKDADGKIWEIKLGDLSSLASAETESAIFNLAITATAADGAVVFDETKDDFRLEAAWTLVEGEPEVVISLGAPVISVAEGAEIKATDAITVAFPNTENVEEGCTFKVYATIYGKDFSSIPVNGEGASPVTLNATLEAGKGYNLAITQVDIMKGEELVKSFQDLPYNVNFTTAEEEQIEDGNVTADFIKNYSFDVESDWIATGNVAINPTNVGTVTDWTANLGKGYSGAAVLKIGSEATMNNAKVPALNAAGAAQGGAFACAASWGDGLVQYTQEVTLLAGTYIFSYDTYEGNSNATAGIDKNLIGFIAADGTEYLAKDAAYTVGEWTSHEIKFTLLEETTGKWSIGYKSKNITSNNTPKLFIDNLKLMKSDVEYPVDLTGKAINRNNGWTKLASAGAINNYSTDYAEFYNAQHVTGEVMQQIVNVPNGNYNVEVYFNANCANWECTPVEEAQGQTGYTVMHINDKTIDTPIQNSKGLTADQPYSYNVNLDVEDGKLAFKIENLKQAANWITVSIRKIELVSAESEKIDVEIVPAFIDGEEEITLNDHMAVSVEKAEAIKASFGDNAAKIKHATYVVNELVEEEFMGVTDIVEETVVQGNFNLNTIAYAQFEEAIKFPTGHKYNVIIKAWDVDEDHLFDADLNPVAPIATFTCEFNGSCEEQNPPLELTVSTSLMLGEDEMAINDHDAVSVENADAIKVQVENAPEAIGFTYAINAKVLQEDEEGQYWTVGAELAVGEGIFNGGTGYGQFEAGTINFEEGNKYQVSVSVMGGNPEEPTELGSYTYEINGSYVAPMTVTTSLMLGEDEVAINDHGAVSVENADAIKVQVENAPEAIGFTYAINAKVLQEDEEGQYWTVGAELAVGEGNFNGGTGYAQFEAGTINFEEGNKYQVSVSVMGGNPEEPTELGSYIYEINGAYTYVEPMISEAAIVNNGEEITLNEHSEVSVEMADGVVAKVSASVTAASYAVRNMMEIAGEESSQWIATDTIAAGEMSINGTAFAEFDEFILFNQGKKYMVTIAAKDAEENEESASYIINGSYEEPEPEPVYDITSQYIKNADLSDAQNGWTVKNFGETKKQANSGYAIEAYAGWGSLEVTEYALTQKITLPAGSYKLTNNSFFRYDGNATVDPSKSSAKLIAGDASVEVKTLGSITAKAYANDQVQGAGVLSSGNAMYYNEVEFTLEEEKEIEIGLVGTFEQAKSWMIAGGFKLYDMNAAEQLPVDYSNMIVNNSFENGTNGWTLEGEWGEQSNGEAVKVGTRYVEKWQATGGLPAGKISQVIEGLPNGKYILTAVANATAAGTVVFANENSVAAPNGAAVVTVETVVKGGTLTIGFERTAENQANWVAVDNFMLSLVEPAEALISEAAIVENGMEVSLNAHSEVSVEQAEAVVAKVSSSVREASYAIRNMMLIAGEESSQWIAADTIVAGEMSINGTAYAELADTLIFAAGSKYMVTIAAKDAEENEESASYIINGSYTEPLVSGAALVDNGVEIALNDHSEVSVEQAEAVVAKVSSSVREASYAIRNMMLIAGEESSQWIATDTIVAGEMSINGTAYAELTDTLIFAAGSKYMVTINAKDAAELEESVSYIINGAYTEPIIDQLVLINGEEQIALNTHSAVSVEAQTAMTVSFNAAVKTATYAIQPIVGYDEETGAPILGVPTWGEFSINTIGYAEQNYTYKQGTQYMITIEATLMDDSEASEQFLVNGAYVAEPLKATISGEGTTLNATFAVGTDLGDNYTVKPYILDAEEQKIDVADYAMDCTTGGDWDPLNKIVITLNAALADGTYTLVLPAGMFIVNGGDNNDEWRYEFTVNGGVITAINSIAGSKTVADGKYLENGKITIVKDGVKYQINGARK